MDNVNYEEIEAPSTGGGSDGGGSNPPNLPRRYSRTASSLKRQAAATAAISSQQLLKRDAIPSHFRSPSPPALPPAPHHSTKPTPPPTKPAKPKVPLPPPKPQSVTVPLAMKGNPELQQRLNQRRQEMYGQMDYPQQLDAGEGPMEGYEEVQFTTNPVKVCAYLFHTTSQFANTALCCADYIV